MPGPGIEPQTTACLADVAVTLHYRASLNGSGYTVTDQAILTFNVLNESGR